MHETLVGIKAMIGGTFEIELTFVDYVVWKIFI
jgi:hypothetical protein